MNLTIALIGAGRMGAFFGNQMPRDAKKIVIDTDEDKARQLAEKIGATFDTSLTAASGADVISIVLPGPAVNPVAAQLGPIAKDGAVVMNMATEGAIDEGTKRAYPAVNFVDAKIIGHARSMVLGAPGYVVVNTEDESVFQKVAYCLPGYAKVVMGDSSVVPRINKIGSGEGIRAAVTVRKLLKQYNIPREWEDIVIYTVCAGTMRSYVEGDLGEFARKLADQLEAEQD